MIECCLFRLLFDRFDFQCNYYLPLMGLPDPREQGSGNPGATNVMRIAAKKRRLYLYWAIY